MNLTKKLKGKTQRLREMEKNVGAQEAKGGIQIKSLAIRFLSPSNKI